MQTNDERRLVAACGLYAKSSLSFSALGCASPFVALFRKLREGRHVKFCRVFMASWYFPFVLIKGAHTDRGVGLSPGNIVRESPWTSG